MKLPPIVTVLVLTVLLPFAVQPQNPAQSMRAGEISALIPVGHVLREQSPLEAAKDLVVLWGDSITTEPKGRVRVGLDDGSVLNIGSNSSLRVVHHNATEQQSELELTFGRVRARVVRITRPAGQFRIRTRVAAVGVVGTDLYVDSTATMTTVIALGGGNVTVQSLSPQFPEVVELSPGELVVVFLGQRPEAKRPATVNELIAAVQDTLAGAADDLASAVAVRGKGLFTLADGTVFEAVLTKTLDGRKAKSGDRVEAKMVRAVKAAGQTVLPKNTRLRGRVTRAEARAKGASESALGVVFETVVLRDGREVPLQMGIQAIASAQTLTASTLDPDWQPRSAGEGAGGSGTSGGLLGGVASTVGSTARTAGSVAGGAASTIDTATPGLAGAANAPVLSPASRGALGLPDLTLQAGGSLNAQGSVITSNKKTVRLNSGTRFLLCVSAPGF